MILFAVKLDNKKRLHPFLSLPEFRVNTAWCQAFGKGLINSKTYD